MAKAAECIVQYIHNRLKRGMNNNGTKLLWAVKNETKCEEFQKDLQKHSDWAEKYVVRYG